MLIVHKECGGAVSDRGICESCGKVLHARDARALPGPGLGRPPTGDDRRRLAGALALAERPGRTSD